MNTETRLTAAAVQRRLQISNGPLEKLVASGRLARREGDRYFNPAGVAELEAMRHKEWAKSTWWDASTPILAVPTNALDLGSSLYLSAGNDRQEAIDGYVTTSGHGQPPGTQVTGWWAVADEGVQRLVDEQGIILGVTGGFVFEAARVIALAKTREFYRRRAFLVAPLQHDELQQYLGYVPKMTPTGFAVARP